MGCVYLARCVVNGKGYVGQTRNTLEWRKRTHEDAAFAGGDCLFGRALRKYGSASFDWSVLTEDDDLEWLCLMEQKWIKRLGTKKPNGYNMTDGGEIPSESFFYRGRVGTAATVAGLEKTRIAVKNAWKDPKHRVRMINIFEELWQDPEHKKQMSEAHEEQAERMRGKTYEEIYGKERADEERTKRAITHSITMKKKCQDPECRKQMSERMKAAWADPEKRKRMLEARRKN